MFSKRRKPQPRNRVQPDSKRVYSYYANSRIKQDNQPERSRSGGLKDRLPQAKSWWRHTPSILALAVIIFCLVYILSINTDPKIIQVGNQKSLFIQDKSTYQTAANKVISKSLLNYNKVTINVAGINKELETQFPELADVSVSIPLINRRPIIYVTASQPALILMTETNTTLVDSRGVAVLPASQVKNLSQYKLPTVKDESGLKINIGKAVLPSSTVKFLSNISLQLQAESQSVEQFVLPAVANEVDVKLTNQKYLIKMDISSDSREQVGAYLAAVKKLNDLQQSPSEYIDVRVLGRVFYK